ncbi:MAG: DUF5658 family protein [Bacillota bacterium]
MPIDLLNRKGAVDVVGVIETLTLIFLLTIGDLLLTYYGLSLGVIREGNPLTALLFNIDPLLAITALAVYVGAACLFIYRVQHRVSWLPAALFGLLVIKMGIICLHLGWLKNYIPTCSLS